MSDIYYDDRFSLYEIIDSEDVEQLREGLVESLIMGDTLEKNIEEVIFTYDKAEIYFLAAEQLRLTWKVNEKLRDEAIVLLKEDIEDDIFFRQINHKKILLEMLQKAEAY